jgi:hypothetical protein
VSRDVQAVVLAEVEKPSHAEVGEELGFVRIEYLRRRRSDRCCGRAEKPEGGGESLALGAVVT